MQALCRVADQLSLPTHRELLQYYGGSAHMPTNPWGDYWCNNILNTSGHSRRDADFLYPDCVYRSELPDDEQWINSRQVRERHIMLRLCITITRGVPPACGLNSHSANTTCST